MPAAASTPATTDTLAAILAELARHGLTRTWEPGSVVVREGDDADALFVVHSGELRVFVAGEGGREVELSTLGAGELFGELMLAGTHRTATVQAVSRCSLTRVSRGEVLALLAANPPFAFQLIQHLADRVRQLTRTVRDLASMDVYGRLVGLLEALAADADGRRVVRGPITQQRIADRVGASRAMIHRLLHDLEDGGYVRLARGEIELLRRLPRRW